jgi:hypothetical protein
MRTQGTRYEAVIARYRSQRKGQADRFALDADACARQLLHALNADRPPRRVAIGRDAFWAGKLKALLPANWWEGLLRRFYGLN